MHVGDIHGAAAAGRVFRCLLAAYPSSLTGWELTMGARVTAVGTRVSEVNQQLRNLDYHCHVVCEQIDGGFWYALKVDDGCTVRAEQVPGMARWVYWIGDGRRDA